MYVHTHTRARVHMYTIIYILYYYFIYARRIAAIVIYHSTNVFVQTMPISFTYFHISKDRKRIIYGRDVFFPFIQ